MSYSNLCKKVTDVSTVFIYGLVDPRTAQCRYVGKSLDPVRRLKGHLRDRVKSHKQNWVKSLKSCGEVPGVFIIEEVSEDSWIEAEVFWIAYFKFIGCDLVNGTAGGDGCNLSPEARQQLIEKLRSPEHRSRMSVEAKIRCAARYTGSALSTRLKLLYTDPRKRAKRIKETRAHLFSKEALKKRAVYWGKVRAGVIERTKATWSASAKRGKSQQSKDLWATPEYRAKVTKVLGTEEARQSNSDRVKQLWATPEYREKQRLLRASAEYKEKKLAGVKRNWEERHKRNVGKKVCSVK